MFKRLGYVLASMGLALVTATSATAEPIAIEDLARQPAMQSVSVSTDGSTMFALIGPSTGDDMDRSVLAAWDLNDLTKPPVLAAPDGRNSEFIFVSALKNGHALTVVRQPFTGRLAGCSEGRFVGSTRTWVSKTLISEPGFSKFDEPFIDTSSMRGMSEASETCVRMEARGSVLSRLPLDPDHILISRFDPRTFSSEVVKLNLETNATEVVFRNSSERSTAVIDDFDGEVMGYFDIDQASGTYVQRVSLRAEKGGAFQRHPELDLDLSNRQELAILHWDNASGLYYIRTNKYDDKAQIFTYDPKTRQLSDGPVFAHGDFDAAGVRTSTQAETFGKILGFTYRAETVRTEWVDPEVGGLVLGLENAFPDQSVEFIYSDDGLNRVIFSVEAPNQPPRYFVLTNKSDLQLLGAARPWIDPSHIGKSQLVYYASRDGLQIPAILTPRAGWQDGAAPGKAIILPHGGPWARDYADWDTSGWIAFLTSRGFTVLQPQYRGSTDWGLGLWKAGDGEYGYKAQDDKDDGAAWLVEAGYAKEDQIGIFGYSYGGYAAMAAATRSGGPYKCAIAGAGYAESDKINLGVDGSRLARMLFADAISGRDVIDDVANAEIPILIYHGDRDVRVPDTFGKAFYNAVRQHTEAKYVNIPDMPHSLPWTPDQHRVSLSAIEAFLDEDCGFDW